MPPKNIPVLTPSFGGREKIASCTSPVTSSSVVLRIGGDRVKAGIDGHVDVKRTDVFERSDHVQDVLVGHRSLPQFYLSGTSASACSVISAPVLSPLHTRMSTPSICACRLTAWRMCCAASLELRECVAGRTPGALSNTDATGAPDEIKRGGNARTCITIPALGRREIIAQALLNIFKRGAEAGQIGFGHRRQELHDQHMTQMRHVGFIRRRKLGEGVRLIRPMHALPTGVEHHQHAPALREGEVRDDWRRTAAVLAASVDNKSAVLEQADTGAGSGPAS